MWCLYKVFKWGKATHLNFSSLLKRYVCIAAVVQAMGKLSKEVELTDRVDIGGAGDASSQKSGKQTSPASYL